MTEPSYSLTNKPEESLKFEPIASNQEANQQVNNCEGITNQSEQSSTSVQIQNVIDANPPLPTQKVTAATETTEVLDDRDNKDTQCREDTNQKLEESDTVECSQEEQTQNAMKVELQPALTEDLGPEPRMSQNDVEDNQMVIEVLEKGNGENELEKNPESEERRQIPQEEDKKEMDPQQKMNENDGHSNRTKEELELREFLLKDENNKEMPCCGDIIEKDGGCNRIECSCGKQVCWVCLEYFDEKDDCYSHLIDIHGGYFEENEIENMIQSGAKKLLCCGNLAFNEGDNHVVCPICRKHSCWLCLEVFTNGVDYNKHSYKAHKDNA